MLTYRLVQPSFAIFKLASLFGSVSFHVKVSFGTLEPRTTACSRLILRVHRVILLLKIIQLLSSIIRLSHSLKHSSKSLNTAVIATIVLCLAVAGLIWSVELEKHHNDIILLLSPLRKSDQIDRFIDLRDRKRNALKRFIHRLVRVYRRVVLYFREVCNDFGRCFPTFSSHDVLTIIVPFAIPSFLCVGNFCAVVSYPVDVFTVSLLNEDLMKIPSLRAATVLFDLAAFSFIAVNFQLFFYIVCATLATYNPELKNLERFIDENGIQSARNVQYVWKEVRRITVIFNILNHLASNCYYAGKIAAFTCCVLGSFIVFRFGVTDLLSVTFAMLSAEGIMFYLLCFGKAYVITVTMENVLRKIRFGLQYPNRICRRELKQKIQSVRTVALREGDFRGMSRETTPEFVDFYVNKVIALVLTF